MSKVYIVFAEGFEEIEGLTVVDLLRRAGIQVQMVGLDTDGTVVGAHGIRVQMDTDLAGIELKDAQAIVLPGGMPGTKHLGASSRLGELLKEADSKKIRLGAICAAPSVLGGLGLLQGKRAVCYPGFEERLTGATVSEESVVTDGHITTSRGMGTAIDFGLELIAVLKGLEESERISSSIIYQK